MLIQLECMLILVECQVPSRPLPKATSIGVQIFLGELASRPILKERLWNNTSLGSLVAKWIQARRTVTRARAATLKSLRWIVQEAKSSKLCVTKRQVV